MTDKYQELTITLDDKFIDLISDFVANIYGDSIEIGKGKIIVRSENDIVYVKNAVESLSDTLGESITLVCNIKELDNHDWVQKYKDSIQPIEAGKFYIHPSWHDLVDGKINIIIDPALAFGSGHHSTTSSCLEAIEEHVDNKHTILDVGCGSGILGLAASRLGATVDLCDTDPRSIDNTRANFVRNDESYRSLWEGSVNKSKAEYDIVLANIISDVLKAIASPLQDRVKAGGILIVSGILDKKESIVLDAYSTLTLIKRKQKEEWVTLIYKKEING
ncbi:MAG: 50S ribosomal protein L11 methyltransferase [Sulfurovum sp.]|nr:50S ribosomal protein L11 methyltransferase [Sulfurovum sp.]